MSISMFKPSEVDISNGLCGSDFNNSELETIARNIIIVSKKSGDQWIEFSCEDYQRLCNHQVTAWELWYLNEMKEKGYLDFKGGKFSINRRFLDVVGMFLDTPERRAKKQEDEEKYAIREAKRKESLEEFKRDLKSHEGEITFDVLKKYAEKSGYSVDYIVRNAFRTDLYISGSWSSSQIAVEANLQAAVNKALEVIVNQNYGW